MPPICSAVRKKQTKTDDTNRITKTDDIKRITKTLVLSTSEEPNSEGSKTVTTSTNLELNKPKVNENKNDELLRFSPEVTANRIQKKIRRKFQKRVKMVFQIMLMMRN